MEINGIEVHSIEELYKKYQFGKATSGGRYHGKRALKVLYRRVSLRNGSFSYQYIPLKKAEGVKNRQGQLIAKGWGAYFCQKGTQGQTTKGKKVGEWEFYRVQTEQEIQREYDLLIEAYRLSGAPTENAIPSAAPAVSVEDKAEWTDLEKAAYIKEHEEEKTVRQLMQELHVSQAKYYKLKKLNK